MLMGVYCLGDLLSIVEICFIVLTCRCLSDASVLILFFK